MFNLPRVFLLKRNGELIEGAHIYHGEIISVSIWYYYKCVINAGTDKKLSSRRYKSCTLCSFSFVHCELSCP